MPTQEANAPPQPLCENLLARPCNPPALRQETTQDSDKRIRFAGSVSLSASCTEYRVEKSHSLLDFERLLQNRIRGTCAAKGIFPG